MSQLFIADFNSVAYIYLDVVTFFQSPQKCEMSLDFRSNSNNFVTGELK